jgi:hypothetical protein
MSALNAILGGKTYTGVAIANSAVHVERLAPNLVRFCVQAGEVHEAMFNTPLVVTSGNDGAHASGSAHYRNEAVDIRSHDISPVQQLSFLIVLLQLGQENGVAIFDERINPDKQHYHCEVSQ